MALLCRHQDRLALHPGFMFSVSHMFITKIVATIVTGHACVVRALMPVC